MAHARGRTVSPLHALAGGVTGTALMSAVLAVETRTLGGADGHLIDYDDSDHVVIAACKVLRRTVPRSAQGKRTIFLLTHWGYGSSVALVYLPIRRRTGSDAVATVALFAGCQAMAFALFPTLGETPAPWRWPRGVLASSLGIHAVYATTVGWFGRTRHSRQPRAAEEPASRVQADPEPC